MSETVKTENDNFVAALRYALVQGYMVLDMGNFKGWMDACDCAACRSQRVVYDFLFDDIAPTSKEAE
jgi:hypothetical protein